MNYICSQKSDPNMSSNICRTKRINRRNKTYDYKKCSDSYICSRRSFKRTGSATNHKMGRSFLENVCLCVCARARRIYFHFHGTFVLVQFVQSCIC